MRLNSSGYMVRNSMSTFQHGAGGKSDRLASGLKLVYTLGTPVGLIKRHEAEQQWIHGAQLNVHLSTWSWRKSDRLASGLKLVYTLGTPG
eukprot:gene31754-6952_t